MEALKRVDIALPTYDDEAVLWGDASPEATVERLQAFGIGEIVVKNGPNSALVASRRRARARTGAGGGRAGRHDGGRRQLQCRLPGGAPRRRRTRRRPPRRRIGSRREKIRHRGAIMPRAAAAMH